MEKKLQTSMPLMCPSCGNIMKKRLDKKMWAIHGKCLDCVVKMESKMRANGTYEAYEQEMMEKNMIAYLQDKEQEATEYIAGLDKISFLQNSNGDIETWDIDPKQIEEVKLKYMEHLKEVREHLKKIKGKK